MIQPPSIQREYSDFWSSDPACITLPDAPDDEADAEAKAAHEKTVAEVARKFERARDTGNWDEVIRPGESPTVFTLRPISGQAMRALLGKIEHNEIAWQTAASLAFRAAIVKIERPTVAFKVVSTKSDEFADYGPIATVDVTNYLDGIDPSIVTELGMRALHRGTTGISPKS